MPPRLPNCSSSIKTAKIVREIGKNLYACRSATPCASDKEQNIWVADKGSTW